MEITTKLSRGQHLPMKNILPLILISFLTINTLLSQELKKQSLELKMRIPEFAGSTLNIGLEYLPSKRFGAEINTGIQISSALNIEQGLISDTDFYTLLQSRFYPFPRHGGDRFYIGAYGLYEYDKVDVSFNQETVRHIGIIGGVIGYKWMKGGFLIDFGIGTGFGRMFTKQVYGNGISVVFQKDLLKFYSLAYLSVGYRFNFILTDKN